MENIILKNVQEKYPECLDRETFKDDGLGGCNVYGDPGSECPKMWRYLVDKYNIKSVLDVGCGFGFHLKYFKDFMGLKVKGVEGSKKVQELSFFPKLIINHDYSSGPLILNEGFDLCWSIEFVEHVGEQYSENFIKTFQGCKYLLMTFATKGQGGYHHVNENSKEYWVDKLDNYGFSLNENETSIIRERALEDFNDFKAWQKLPDDEKPERGVASLYNKDVGFLLPHVPECGLFFTNDNP
tara:strand:+ start:1260 stop:1979 length:720 start_codon:yes stop_codon:yes gene_type:complete